MYGFAPHNAFSQGENPAQSMFKQRQVRPCLASANPKLTGNTLALMLALALIASGLARAWWTFARPTDSAWRSVAASGVVTALVGIVFAIGWPREIIWIIGTLLAMDLAWPGLMTVAFGLTVKKLPGY